MSDMLIIGSSAVSTFRKALDVTSHNVANVATEGYSRQRAEIYSNTPSIVGSSFLGGGSRIDVVERMYADYIQKQLVSTNASVKGYESALSYSKQVEGIIAGNDEGVQQFIQRYFDSLQNLADNPTSRVNRQLVLDEANNLTGHLNNISVVLDDTQFQVNTQLTDLTKDINRQLEIIQNVNKMVAFAQSQGRQPPNDLLDQREQAILNLSDSLEVKTYRQPDGTIDVHTINGKVPLLSDNTLTRLESAMSPYPNENRVEIYANIGGQRRVVSDQLIGGGEMGGILDFRKNMLDRAQNDLGVTLNGMVNAMNWQHYQGYDENGNPGKSLFEPIVSNGLKASSNLGVEDGSNIKVTFNPNPTNPTVPYTQPESLTYGEKEAALQEANKQIGRMESRSYELIYNGSEFEFYDYGTKRPVRDLDGTVFSVAPGEAIIAEGLHFDFTDVDRMDIEPGDRFVMKPHQDVLKQFGVSIRDGEELATRGQNPVEEFYLRDVSYVDAGANLVNFDIDVNRDGITSYEDFMGLVNQLYINNPPDPALTEPYAAGDPLTVEVFNEVVDWIADKKGLPAPTLNLGETLDKNGNGIIARNEFSMFGVSKSRPAGEGDNVNMANMASLQSKKILYSNKVDQPSETLLGGYSKMASSAGMYVRAQNIQFEAQTNTYNYILERRETLSGVSLDEEAANLMRFQQAYQAAAQVMQASQQIFQTLLSAMRA